MVGCGNLAIRTTERRIGFLRYVSGIAYQCNPRYVLPVHIPLTQSIQDPSAESALTMLDQVGIHFRPIGKAVMQQPRSELGWVGHVICLGLPVLRQVEASVGGVGAIAHALGYNSFP